MKINKSKKAKKVVRKKTTKPKTALVKAQPRRRIKDPVAYYNCLCQQAQAGFAGKKITQACQECKSHAPILNAQYQKEVKKLVGAYRQLGVSLSKIIK